ncbi:hypothetical protein VTI74DRAFT_10497 [Chaetomium olivicolor]
MASKHVFTTSLPSIARLCSPAPARLALLQPRQYLPTIPTRLAHGIPRPRNFSPFKQQQQKSPPVATPPTPSSETTSPSCESKPQPPAQKKPPNIRQQPHYELTFTCRPCGERSRHRVSKQGYHYGSVLIACPGCRNRHVISDHLRIFGDTAMTVEDLLKERGELVKRGTLGEDEDIEFWEDGTTSVREPWGEDEMETTQGEVNDAPPGSTFKSVRPGERKGEE